MFGYKLLKIASFFIYWLGFAPWLVLILRRENVITAFNLHDIFVQYTAIFLFLIIVYLIVHQVFEYFYLRHKIKKTIRKVTVSYQLKRLERGEIDLKAAQRVSTFIKLKEPATPQAKRKLGRNGTKQQGETELESKICNDLFKDLAEVESEYTKNQTKKQAIKQLLMEEGKDKSTETGQIRGLDGKIEALVPPSYHEAVLKQTADEKF